MVLEDVQDPVIATAVLSMGDGLYQQASMGLLPSAEAERQEVLGRLMEALDRLTIMGRRDRTGTP